MLDRDYYIPEISSQNYTLMSPGGTNVRITQEGALVEEWDYWLQQPIDPDDTMLGYRESHYAGKHIIYPEHVSEISMRKTYITDDKDVDGNDLILWRVFIFVGESESTFKFMEDKSAETFYRMLIEWKQMHGRK